jgi:tRNA (cmo5U34)-methyltransferase
LPDELAAADWDGVSCVWTLHQLPDFDILRGALRQIAAVRGNCGAALWIFDFQRLNDPSALASMAPCVDPSIPPVLRKDALASEAAGFTLAELSAELAAAGLGGMSHGHARPLPYLQAHWMPADGAQLNGHRSRTSDGRLSRRARGDAALLRWGFTAKPFV